MKRIEFDGKVHEFPDDFSEDEISAALSGPSVKDTAVDAAKSFGTGVGRGVIGLIGLPGEVAGWGAAGLDKATQFVGGLVGADVAPRKAEPAIRMPNIADVQRGVESVTGDFYKPKSTVGEYAQTVGEFAPGMLMGPSSIGARAVTNVLLPGIGSEAAGHATEGTAAEPVARVAGALLGAVSPSVAARAITPFPARPRMNADDIAALRAEGIDVTAGQATGRTGLQRFEARSGGSKYEDTIDRQGEQFTRAAMRRTGQNTTARADDIDAAFTRVGQQFDDLAARNWAEFDGPFTQDMQRVRSEYQALVPESMRAPIVDNVMQDILGVQQNAKGVLTGEQYQAWRSRLDKAARSSQKDPQLAEALFGIRAALDDVAERTIARRNPVDLGAWQEARGQYRNLLAVERASTGAGAEAASGLITPAQLAQGVKNVHGRRNYARGRGDLSELSRAGVSVLGRPSTSGTAENLSAMNLIAMLLNAPPRVAARAALSRPGRAYLGNQTMAGTRSDLDPRRAAIIQLLMSPARREQLPALLE